MIQVHEVSWSSFESILSETLDDLPSEISLPAQVLKIRITKTDHLELSILVQVLELVEVSEGVFEVSSVIDDGGKIGQSLLNLINVDTFQVLELEALDLVVDSLGIADSLADFTGSDKVLETTPIIDTLEVHELIFLIQVLEIKGIWPIFFSLL